MKKLILSTLMLAATLTMSAIPAKREWRTVSQSDGTKVTLMLVGDENFHCYQTTDGVPVIEENGNYYYANAIGDYLQKTDMLAHDAEMRSFQESQAIAQFGNEEDINRMWKAAPNMQHLRPHRAIGEANGVYEGSKKGIIILVSFNDLDFKDENAKDLYNNIANTPGYKYNSKSIGSVHDYFTDQSNGKFDLTFDVVGPYKAPKSVKYYGENSYGGDQHGRIVELLKFACNSADAEVDFKDYDWDGDGNVDQVFMLYAGEGEATGGPSYTIWPHESYIGSGPLTAFYLDGVRINTYACSNELTYNTLSGIGTFCHEFTHCLGLPDFYDITENSGNQNANYAMGPYDLMCSGSYNGDSWKPAAYTAYERNFCGWMDLTELTDPIKVEGMKPITDGGEAYVMYNPGNRNEYYIMEHRNNISSWDRGLPGKGLLIYHVNYIPSRWKDNSVNVGDTPCMAVVPADNIANSSTTRNDLYPYKNIMGGENSNLFSDDSKPAATLYNANTDGTKLLHVKVSDITYTTSSKTISFVFNDGAISKINSIGNDDNTTELYNLNGVKLGNNIDINTLPKGLYIVKSKDKSQKIAIQ